MKKQIHYELTIVTPDMAAQWLQRLHPLQRNLSEAALRKIDTGVAKVGWQREDARVHFDEEGLVMNGRHTLHWIANQADDREVMVARNVPHEYLQHVNNVDAQPWAIADIVSANIAKKVSKNAVATCRFLRALLDEKPVTDHDQVTEAVRRWLRVANAGIGRVPSDSVVGSRLLKVMIWGPVGVLELVDQDRCFGLVRQLTGARAIGPGAKELLKMLDPMQWSISGVATPKGHLQALRVLRCLEIGAGFQPEKQKILIDADVLNRWKDLSRRALERAEAAV